MVSYLINTQPATPHIDMVAMLKDEYVEDF